MLKKYKIILLKNSVPKKTLFSSNVKRTTQHKFHKFINGKKPLFHKEYVKRKYCQFELGIFLNDVAVNDVYRKDSVGRNVLVKINAGEYNLIELSPYWVEELFYDHQEKRRVTLDYLLTTYLPKQNFKQVFTLNNKLIIQNDDIFKIFSLKTVWDCSRALGVIQNLFIDAGRTDTLLVPDNSTPQRKQLYKLLIKYGFDKRFLYKQYTY